MTTKRDHKYRCISKKFPCTACQYFYETLYDKSVEEADIHGITHDKLMSQYHIQWETKWHLLANYLGFSNADEVNLNEEETVFSMIGRGFESLLSKINLGG